MSPRKIRRRPLDAGLKSCRAEKKRLLSEKAKQKRLQWALEHRNVNWNNVMFSDEIYGPLILRRKPEEEYLPECLNTAMKRGGVRSWFGDVLQKVALGIS